ncbi:pilus assembly protein [Aquincola sp. S2]|uniref:Pilus assembly protein n=1 Tax=Pseudaquabacterium terrae TaxID=2732868 RepID=A0ABX2EKN7_9BURK|nr:pilus assembly protein [Aquabacterium terrae]
MVAALAAALVFLLWYPWPYSVLAGGTGLFLLITGVDVVMGPLITFAVFDRRKPWRELRRDLAVVVALQLAALVYGLYVMHAVRPVVMALEGDRLRVVTANDVVLEELPKALPPLQTLSNTGPLIIATATPSTADEQFDAIQQALGGLDMGMRPKFWRPWDDAARASSKAVARPLAEMRKRYPERAAELDAAIQRTGRTEQQLRYLPILARHADWIALVDAGSGDIIGFAPFNAY